VIDADSIDLSHGTPIGRSASSGSCGKGLDFLRRQSECFGSHLKG
jgi:hypothetical protein